MSSTELRVIPELQERDVVSEIGDETGERLSVADGLGFSVCAAPFNPNGDRFRRYGCRRSEYALGTQVRRHRVEERQSGVKRSLTELRSRGYNNPNAVLEVVQGYIY